MRPCGMPYSGGMRLATVLLTLVLCWPGGAGDVRAVEAQGDSQALDFFEQHVRPLLLQRCGACHIDDSAGGLSLASREGLLSGGDSGPAVVPGDDQASRLVRAIRRQGDAPMPPDEALSNHEIAILEQWVRGGAPWTTDLGSRASPQELAEHWAFQPIQDPAPPTIARLEKPRSAIDAFILQRLDAAGIAQSPPADRRTLIRRVTYALTGLPPTPHEIEAFIADDDPQAYERLIDRLLASPAYGEHAARMWLDLARYSDTKGYVYAREERHWVHAWNYRDWVVAALNQDMPYDRFLLLQIAADQVENRSADDLAAMGFLTVGRRFLGVKHDIIDDRIDVVCRTAMALTVACARCHDHKYDPIPTADYYALYGIFDSCVERLSPLPDASKVLEDPSSDVWLKREALRSALAARRAEQAERIRGAVGEYLWAQTELHKYPRDGFDQIFGKEDLLPAVVRRFQTYLAAADRQQDPLFVAWHAYRSVPPESFAESAPRVTASLQAGELGRVNRHVLDAFREAPQSMRQVAERYANVFQRSMSGDFCPGKGQDQGDEDAAQLSQFLCGDRSPCRVPDRGIVHIEAFFPTETVEELWKLQSELDRAILAAGESAPFAVTLTDGPRPAAPRIFRRGNPLDPGPTVPRRFLTVLSSRPPQPFEQGSGRLELAQRIVAPSNPLTPRVIVNRVWSHHFGRGLVPTTSDFGRRAEDPSHPELLDYLARRFIEQGWNLKALHRSILLSSTYRQDSSGPDDADALAKARQIDPENRLLWRMHPRRLTFEEMRDSLLAAAGTLDRRLGGTAETILQPPFSPRRTVYGLVDRQFLPSSFRVFDFASPDLHIAQRNETTTAQQALFLMNDPFMVHQASRLAEDLDATENLNEQIDTLFQRVLRRAPTDQERKEASTIVTSAVAIGVDAPSAASRAWRYGYGAMDDQLRAVAEFQPLPYRNEDAWQGSAAYPDPALGWVRLTAAGGHPGNDHRHASIRRWVAPRAMVVRVRSELTHEPAAGDGVRAFIVSSEQGILQSARAHHQSVAMDVEEHAVAPGETIDFVVDIDQVLNSDQYQWRIIIDSTGGASGVTAHWDSVKDFVGEPAVQLTPLAQLAQVLMCSNEFLFID